MQNTQTDQLLVDLQQLIAALDRRVPQLSHSGEPDIALEAAALRERAVRLIRQVQGQPSETVPSVTP